MLILILMMEPPLHINQESIRLVLLLGSFGFLVYLVFKSKQNAQVNWAMFYATLWVSLSLVIVNYLCVKLGYWTYISDKPLSLDIPLDLYFSWVVLWGVVVTYFLKSKFVFTSLLFIFWLDILYMPLMQQYGVLYLRSDWYIGEAAIILFVLLPARLWTKWSLEKTNIVGRTLLQIVCVGIILFFILPYSVHLVKPLQFSFDSPRIIYSLQVFFIIALPALIAVRDLVTLGKGTPFPYDETKLLVTNGVYAYIQNPIQWSMTVIFIPLAWFFSSPLLLLGSLVSFAYCMSLARVQEGADMVSRFGDAWLSYKCRAPVYRFLWKPSQMGQATIHFRKDCNVCQEVKEWFERRNPVSLKFEDASLEMQQVTYIDQNKNRNTSVLAISYALGHINLVYASLGWLMRFPGFCFLLQLIVDATIPPKEIGCAVEA